MLLIWTPVHGHKLSNEGTKRVIHCVHNPKLVGKFVYPREVVKAALTHNASTLILAHNHPSGEVEPSKADLHLTKRLQQALALVDISILDHIVVAGRHTYSFSEHGRM